MNVYKANAYTKNSVEIVDAVMGYLYQNTTYECTVYVNPVIKNGKLVSYSGKSGTAIGKTDLYGYYTIDIPDPAYVTEGDTFSVVIKTDRNQNVGLFKSA